MSINKNDNYLKKEIYKTVSKLTKEHLDKTGKSQTQLSNEINVVRSYISNIINEHTFSIASFTLQKLMNEMNIPIYRIFENLDLSNFEKDDYYSLFNRAYQNNIMPKDLENAIYLFKTLNLNEVSLDE
ncbi:MULTISPECIES: helix-turn-helix domain-containing protein [unclassified Candidatus Frackibacter]|uniref:helix-turn-helix domain-containing protein n=1 Tax=unclassified Candidatus Frackibacter TaxID=2648818 RepID=UPI00088B5419|nr:MULTISPECIES: helix-turn-helix transcriptional regulator [unclassified Candidatus Frackibacter]SDC76312.1 hypothetical protein SAMN04515661_12349 [Candidatus Frackibacter sp. WG11]SEM89771.1 hypothetical protein SAMN04488698_12348 [Candidatus Frackibacter sp. WG12]SFL99256.1 hypothetical protein SAMN04488699_12448 [Candidatus Frackibacter sp. WG13]